MYECTAGSTLNCVLTGWSQSFGAISNRTVCGNEREREKRKVREYVFVSGCGLGVGVGVGVGV